MKKNKTASIQAIIKAKKLIIDVGLMCWQKGWVAGTDGNISCKIRDTQILCTATGVSKGMLTMDHICLVNPDGELLQKSTCKPSTEIKMHLRVFKERPDIKCVLHAHPPYATAHAIAGIPLTECVVPEIVVGFGSIPLVPYGTPTTNEIPDRLAPFLKDYDAWLLANHGALTAGADPLQAYFRMESVELYAQTMYYARGLGKVNTLGKAQVKGLMDLKIRLGIKTSNITKGNPDKQRTHAL